MGRLSKCDPARFDTDEQERIRARFLAEWPAWYNAVSQFCSGEPGHRYGAQQEVIADCLDTLRSQVQKTQFPQGLLANLRLNRERLVEQILCVQIPIDSVIYESRTPFTTYCFVRDLCATVRKQLVWLDRYFDHTLFHRFFFDTARTAEITLVTLPGATLTNPKDKRRHADFVDVSRSFAQERGSQAYRLIENAHFHDRWLRCDDKLFTLGGSIKDLDKGPFTISRLDAMPGNLQQFDDAVALGIEIFGPNHPSHP